ncbi:TIGR02301 family protein [Aurantimonas sp. A2-1-M11]|uniref:TIGR02301 family protein n=1 Tax=Aurantimonas sp. A2-1-M11 TaxID=3113712 RepID=UPI002F94C8E4
MDAVRRDFCCANGADAGDKRFCAGPIVAIVLTKDETSAMRRMKTAAMAVMVVCLAGFVAVDHRGFAQESAPEEAAPEAPLAVRSEAPFMKPLGRLASILGSVHFLRTLCGDEDGAVWRVKMEELLAAQAPGEADRRYLVGSFNSGYRAFESTYRECTPAARVAVNRYQGEGVTLAREISARYGN